MNPRPLLLVLLAGCAAPPAAGLLAGAGLLPGNIGIAVERKADAVAVAAVKKDSAAAAAGVRPGDVVRSYNGAAVASPRAFNRLVLDSAPGSTARLELARDGVVRWVELPVRQIDTAPAS